MREMKHIVTIPVVLDALDLVKGEVKIEDEVESALACNDDISEDVAYFLFEKIADKVLAQEVSDAVLEAQIESYMRHLVVRKDKTEVNYSETSCLDDRSLVSFDVPCILDVAGFLGEILPPAKVQTVLGSAA